VALGCGVFAATAHACCEQFKVSIDASVPSIDVSIFDNEVTLLDT
jgi:hypothetical protein